MHSKIFRFFKIREQKVKEKRNTCGLNINQFINLTEVLKNIFQRFDKPHKTFRIKTRVEDVSF